MSCPISMRLLRHDAVPPVHIGRPRRNGRAQRGTSPPSYVMWTPLVYSSSGRFHGNIQKSNASLSARTVKARAPCEMAVPSGTAMSKKNDAQTRRITDIGYTEDVEGVEGPRAA